MRWTAPHASARALLLGALLWGDPGKAIALELVPIQIEPVSVEVRAFERDQFGPIGPISIVQDTVSATVSLDTTSGTITTSAVIQNDRLTLSFGTTVIPPADSSGFARLGGHALVTFDFDLPNTIGPYVPIITGVENRSVVIIPEPADPNHPENEYAPVRNCNFQESIPNSQDSVPNSYGYITDVRVESLAVLAKKIIYTTPLPDCLYMPIFEDRVTVLPGLAGDTNRVTIGFLFGAWRRNDSADSFSYSFDIVFKAALAGAGPGDLNTDGAINILDSTLLRRFLAGLPFD